MNKRMAERASNVASAEKEKVQQAEAKKASMSPNMSLRTVVDEFENFKEWRHHVRFPFKAPMDGCYMLEEWHSHRPKEAQPVPYTVNYCKGRSAPVAVNHTDERHGQWNYVAHFPYYDDAEGAGVEVPRRVLGESKDEMMHAFRYTYVGRMCSAAEAQVHRMELRSAPAEFSSVKHRLVEFKETLRQTLAGPAGVALERILVSHVRAGSVIAEVTVLPASVHAPGIPPSSQQSAAAAVVAIEKALSEEDDALGREICALADPAGGSSPTCTTQLIAKGPARPLLIEKAATSSAQQKEEQEEGLDGDIQFLLITCAVVGALSAAILGARILSRRCKKSKSQEAEEKELPVDVEKILADLASTAVVAPVKKVEEHGVPDDTSTITPKDDDLEKASDIQSETA